MELGDIIEEMWSLDALLKNFDFIISKADIFVDSNASYHSHRTREILGT